jgi:hypothetical protein
MLSVVDPTSQRCSACAPSASTSPAATTIAHLRERSGHMACAEDRLTVALTVARLCKELGTQRRPRLAPDPDRFTRHHDAPPPQDPERWRAGGN